MLKAIRWRIRRQALALILALSAQPSMNGKAHDGGASQADSSTLYEAAKAHGNREAAAECSAKAGEALEAGDYDKAVSLPRGRGISFSGVLEETHLLAIQSLARKSASPELMWICHRGPHEAAMCAGAAVCKGREAGTRGVHRGGCQSGSAARRVRGMGCRAGVLMPSVCSSA